MADDNDNAYGNWLRAERLEAGLTQEELAEQAGLSDGTAVSRIERGQRVARTATRRRLEQALDAAQGRGPLGRFYDILETICKIDSHLTLDGSQKPPGWEQLVARSKHELNLRRATNPPPRSSQLRVIRGG